MYSKTRALNLLKAKTASTSTMMNTSKIDIEDQVGSKIRMKKAALVREKKSLPSMLLTGLKLKS